MRVVLLVHEFPVASETFIVQKFLGLRRRGVDVYVVADRMNPDAWSRFASVASDREARRRTFGWSRNPLVRVLQAVMQTAAAFAQRPRAAVRCLVREVSRFGPAGVGRAAFAMPIVRRAPDVVHHEFGASAIHRGDIGHAVGAAMTCSFRGFDLNYESLEQPQRFDALWPRLSGVHVLGEDLLARARDRGMPESMRVAVIPPAVDVERFRPRHDRAEPSATGDTFRILSIGRLHWKKGYEFAIDAVAALVDRGVDVRYRIIGGGSFEAAIRASIEARGLGSRVVLLGETDQDAVVEELRRADVLLHAAVSEGFCNAVMEAQAVGVPVVCSDADGLRENIADGVTGLIVPRRDAASTAEALERFAREAALRRSFGAAGRARVEERFRPDVQIERFEAFFRDVVEANS